MTSDKTAKLTHLDDQGRAKMVAVDAKPETKRTAIAASVVRMSAAAFDAVVSASGPKGDAIQVARIAGIMAAKKTSELIPLCHPIALSSVQVEAVLQPDCNAVKLVATAVAVDRTGVEMEAMTASAVAGLALYDMIKGMDRTAYVGSVALLSKRGGKSGDFKRSGEL